MKILCISDSLENKVVYNYIKMFLGNCMTRDITVRNPLIRAMVNDIGIEIRFASFNQDVLCFGGFSPSLVIVTGDFCGEWAEYIDMSRRIGVLVLQL